MKITIDIDDAIDKVIFCHLLKVALDAANERADQVKAQNYARGEACEEAFNLMESQTGKAAVAKLSEKWDIEAAKVQKAKMAVSAALHQMQQQAYVEHGKDIVSGKEGGR